MTYSVKSCGKRHSHCKVCRPDVGAKLSFALSGRTLSSEHRKNIRAASLGRTLSVEARTKVGLAHLGRPLSIEHREKLSTSIRTSVRAIEARAKLHASNRGRSQSAEVRAKISRTNLAHRAACTDPGCRRFGCNPPSPRSPTVLDRALGVLLAEFPTVVYDQRLPGACCAYRPDAFLPEYALCFEADGAYWHAKTRRERGDDYYDRRDAHLLAVHGLVTVRLTETALSAATTLAKGD